MTRRVAKRDRLELLRSSRAVLAQGWCRGAFARKRNNSTCDIMHPDACRFCAEGAVNRAAVTTDRRHAELSALSDLQDTLRLQFNSPCIVNFNDHTAGRGIPGKKRVIQLFDDTIARLEGR